LLKNDLKNPQNSQYLFTKKENKYIQKTVNLYLIIYKYIK
jgi:hypothetical protein